MIRHMKALSLELRLLKLLMCCPPSSVLAIHIVTTILLMTPVASIVDPSTTLGCHIRRYEQHITKPPFHNSDGSVVKCSGKVSVNSCWGRCDSSEVGDYQMPFRISTHPVCTYTGRINRVVTLSDCEGYPDPTEVVFDAAGCECRLCNSDYTSCENLNG